MFTLCMFDFPFIPPVGFLLLMGGASFTHSFNFGDISPSQNKKESPSIQLLSRTDQLQTFQSFVPTRKITLQSRAPLYDITRLANQTGKPVDWSNAK